MAKNSDALPQFKSCLLIPYFMMTVDGGTYAFSHRISANQVAPVSRSRIMARTLTKDTAMVYIQKPNAITNIPVSMLVAILGARVTLTDAP